MSRRECSKIVIVPGILGSELILEDTDPSKAMKSRLIWGEDLNVIWHSLAVQPNLLTSDKVRAGKLLRYLSGFPFPLNWKNNWKRVPVYGPLFEHLSKKYNVREGIDLLEFGYDWRSCNVKSGEALGEFLLRRTEPEDRLVLIAHSMGGLVCRALLANPAYSSVEARISKVIQLGTPVLGSPKAYFTLKNQPKVSAIFDAALRNRHRINPELYHYLRTSLETFQSLFQMLPPLSEQIVFDDSGTQYSALNEDLWKKELAPLLKGAEMFHTLIQGVSSEKLFTLYSTKILTERAYLIDEMKRVISPSEPLIYGDGTVSISSAVAATEEQNRVPFENIKHDILPNSPEVWKSLEKLL